MEVLQDFEAALVLRGVATACTKNHLRVLRRLDAFLGPKALFDASGSDLVAYLAHRRDCDGIAASSARKERQFVLAFFSWAHETGQISAKTLAALRKTVTSRSSTVKVIPKPYEAKEICVLRASIDSRWPRMDYPTAQKGVERWRRGVGAYARIRGHAIRLQLDAVIALALHCGLRRGEIRALRLDDLHPDNSYIVVWRGGRWASAYREVPFTDAARAAVAAWLDFRAGMGVEHENPWLNLWSEKTAREPIKLDTFAKLLSGYVGAKWNFRRLRCTCAVEWLKAGMTPLEVQQLLGHGALKELAPYCEAAQRPLEDRVERLQDPFAEAVPLA